MLCFSCDATSVQQICQSTLHDFNLCMFRQDSEHHPGSMTAVVSADDRPSRLSNEMVFKIIVICLAMIHVMQKDGQFHRPVLYRLHRVMDQTNGI